MKVFQKWSVLFSILFSLTLLTACQGGGDPLPVEPPPAPTVSEAILSPGPKTKPDAFQDAETLQPEETAPASSTPAESPAESTEPNLPETDIPEAELPEAQLPETEPAANTTLYVLMYHSFVPEGTECNDWTLTDTRFREDLQWLYDNGYTTVLPSELAAGKPLPDRAVMLTFDDGYKNNYTVAYPILKEFQAKAVISLVTNQQFHQNTDHLSWEECKEMVDSGLVEIGSHTYNCHNETPQGIVRMEGETKEEYQARVLTDIQTSIDLIEKNVGTTVQFFAYPYGLTDPWSNDYLKEHFDVTVTTKHGSTDISKGLYKMNRCNISVNEPPSKVLPAK